MGSKHLTSKDRLSLLLCMNLTGTDKLPPLLIGKAARPHALRRKGVGLSKVNHYHNSSGRMTAVVFEHWLDKWNEIVARQQRHILLLIDNASSHITKEYSNIRVEFWHQTPNQSCTTRSGHSTCLQDAVSHYLQQLTNTNVRQ